MHIYPSEIEDGLGGKLKNSAIAMNCQVKKYDNPTSVNINKAKAAFGNGRNFDVYYLSSILASIGANINDDVFQPEELWAARDTPVHKQFNYGHNEKDVIGCIFDSFLLDSAGELITSEDRVSEITDIGTHAVIWTHWEDSELQKRMNRTIAEIENGEQFVSMEVLFKNFDYLLIDNATKDEKIITRSEGTAFLTKYLRSFGGDGLYKSYSIKRVLRSFTFSGKGLVRNPANPNSIIDPKVDDNLDFNLDHSKQTIANSNKKGTFNMSQEVLERQVNDLSTQLQAAKAEIDAVKAAHAKEKETVVSAEIDKLTKQIASYEVQKEELTKLVNDAKAETESVKAEATESVESYKNKLDAAQAEIETLKQERVTAARVAKLIEVGNSVERSEEICSTWAAADDAQFDELVKLYKSESEFNFDKKDKDKDKDKKDMDKEDKKSEASDDFDNVVDKSSADVKIPSEDANEDMKAIAQSIQDKLLNKDTEE